jgi:hypothetical protein
VVLTTAAGERTFFVGSSAGTRRNAFRIAGDGKIFATDFSAGSVNVAPNGWIDTKYTTVPTDDVEKITLTRAGTTIVLDRASGAWVPTENGAPVVPAAGNVLAHRRDGSRAQPAQDDHGGGPGRPGPRAGRRRDHGDPDVQAGGRRGRARGSARGGQWQRQRQRSRQRRGGRQPAG